LVSPPHTRDWCWRMTFNTGIFPDFRFLPPRIVTFSTAATFLSDYMTFQRWIVENLESESVPHRILAFMFKFIAEFMVFVFLGVVTVVLFYLFFRAVNIGLLEGSRNFILGCAGTTALISKIGWCFLAGDG